MSDNAALGEELNHYKDESTQWRDYYHEKEKEADNLREQYYAARTSSNAWQAFWMLEQSYQSGDYESCAALLLLIAQRKYAYYSAPSDSERDLYVKVVQAVLDEGILAEDYLSHISDYEEMIDAYLAEHEEVTVYD